MAVRIGDTRGRDGVDAVVLRQRLDLDLGVGVVEEARRLAVGARAARVTGAARPAIHVVLAQAAGVRTVAFTHVQHEAGAGAQLPRTVASGTPADHGQVAGRYRADHARQVVVGAARRRVDDDGGGRRAAWGGVGGDGGGRGQA